MILRILLVLFQSIISLTKETDYIDYKINGTNQNIRTDKNIQKTKEKVWVVLQRPKFIRAWLWFVYNYYFKFGLDGVEGIYIISLNAIGIAIW